MIQFRHLKVGDKFRLPSTNGHDRDGFRHYTITSQTAAGFQTVDNHGYESLLTNNKGTKQILRDAERE